MSRGISGETSPGQLGRDRASDGVGAPAVDAAHQAALEALLGTFSTAVALEMHCDLVDAESGEPHNREAFRAHFPALDGSLERWNATIDRVAAAPEALWRRFAGSARDRGLTEPPFMVGVLIDQLATWTLEGSRRGELDSPQESLLEHFDDRVGGSPYVSVYLMGRRVAMLPGGPQAEVERRVEAADNLIRGLFEEARGCDEAAEIADTRETLLGLKHHLLEDLDVEKAAPSIAFAADCPRCQARSARNGADV